MAEKLLIVDGDGTVSEVKNPYYELAKRLSCYPQIRQDAEQYLAGLISYRELIRRQNPVFREAGRKYALEHGYPKLDQDRYAVLLRSILGSNPVLQSTKNFLDRARRAGYEIAMISSGWDSIIAQIARAAGIAYWRANGVLFIDGEFSGTIVRVEADKIREFKAAVAAHHLDYTQVVYMGDNAFDIPGMKFIHNRGGECLLRQRGSTENERLFPPYVLRFQSLEDVGDYLERWPIL